MKRDAIGTINLPAANGKLAPYHVREPKALDKPRRAFTRIAYAAAHVVADPLSTREPWPEIAVDWDATIAYRRHLWSWGLGVAEAMDTAQRGMGMDWTASLELIRRTLEAARDVPAALVGCGAGTDHLATAPDHPQVLDAHSLRLIGHTFNTGRRCAQCQRRTAADEDRSAAGDQSRRWCCRTGARRTMSSSGAAEASGSTLITNRNNSMPMMCDMASCSRSSWSGPATTGSSAPAAIRRKPSRSMPATSSLVMAPRIRASSD